MGRKRPRSKTARSPRASVGSETEGERARLRRNRPLSLRSALLLLVPLALLAAFADVGLYAFVSDHYARHGHFAFPLDVGLAAIALTALTVYGAITMWRELRKSHDPSPNPPNATGKARPSKEPP